MGKQREGDKAAPMETDGAMARYQEELESVNLQLEQAISRANQMAMMAELANAELHQIFRNAADGIRVIDREGGVVRFNETFLRLTGQTAEAVEGTKCSETFPCSLCQSRECPLIRIVAGAERTEDEVQVIRGPDGGTTFYLVRASPFLAPDGELLGIVEYVLDISRRKQAEQALQESERRYRELSIKDELTGLYNKRYLNHHLPLEIERSKRHQRPFCLLLMDIDNFKHHNDTYGHASGDQVLARLGQVIGGSIRINDIACRFGGEEFVLILPETAGGQAEVVAERIRTRFAAEDFWPRPEEQVKKTISIGIAQHDPGEGAEDLLERADANMYLAKQQGRNRVVWR